MDFREKIISLIRIKGPIIPSQISKQIEQDLLMTSAMLAELSASGKVKVSALKIGGTPLYFLPGQESMLQNFIENLHDKERKAFSILKEKKVLRDSALEPVVRVALGDIKDFAVPLQVTGEGRKEVFWKWFLLSKEEAEQSIKSFFEAENPKEHPPEANKTPEKIETQQSLKDAPEIEVNMQPKAKRMAGRVEEKPKKPKVAINDGFMARVEEYLISKKVTIIKKEAVKVNLEGCFLVEIPTSLGSVKYCCIAKNKKKISDTDISSAYAMGQLKRLPVMLLTNGELTGKASELADNEFTGILINRLD